MKSIFKFSNWLRPATGLKLRLGGAEAVLALWILLFGTPMASAQSVKTPLRFDETTWAQLLKTGPRPAAYLFTTSYCSTCPEAFEVLHHAVQSQRAKVELAAVMMDVSGPQAMRHASHFMGLTQMYAFEGFEPALRQGIDPNWPNVTPYAVLIDKRGRLQKTIGPPSKTMLQKWLP